MIRSTRWLVVATGFATVMTCTLLLPAEASAQRRVGPRPARSRVVHVPHRPYRPVSYAPFYIYRYGGFSPRLYSGCYHPYGFYPYGYWAQPYPYRRYYADFSSAARLQVEPKEAQVYIDGYFVGIVDDFDGWAQRLRLAPGERELEIHLDGYRPFRQKVLFRPGATLTIRQLLQPLGPGETPEARPTPSEAAPQSQPPAAPSTRRGAPEPPRRGMPPAPEGTTSDYGAIAVRVQPRDAEVIVNGERWESPLAGDLTLQLSGGTHRIEVRKDGFRTYTADIAVRRGETTMLNVSLSR